MRLSFLSAAVLIMLLPIGAAAHNPDIDAAVTVHMTPQGYEPRNVAINQGKTIAFENVSSAEMWPASNIHPTHEIYSAFDPKQPLAPGETWLFTFDRAGKWLYHDHLYPTISGTIAVTVDGLPEAGETLAGQADNPLRRLVDSLAAWLRGFMGPAEDTATSSADAEPGGRPYDPNIAADDESIFSDYDRLYSYVKKFGTAKTMQHLHGLSGRLGSCHDAAHRVGRFAFEVTGNQAFQTCTAECHSGCYHGATERFFKENGTANLNESLPTICSFSTNDFYSHQCVHGIGHGLMAWENYDLPQALTTCDLLERPTSRESCYTGVFMENIVGTLGESGADGHYTNYLNDDPLYPCSIVEDRYQGSCYFLQTSRMMTLFGGDFAKIAAACSEVPERFQRHCFGSMGRDVGGVHRGDAPGAIAACQAAPAGAYRNDCLAGAVQDTFWDPSGQDEALAFCALLQRSDEKERCYQTIFERAPHIIADIEARRRFCAKAEPRFQPRCSV